MLDGRTYSLCRYVPDSPHALHGNGWQRPWHVVAQDRASAILELTHDAVGARRAEWPFPYHARHCYSLTEDALELTLCITNTGESAFPFGLGWHPHFPRTPQTVLRFNASGVWTTDATHLPVSLCAIPVAWDFHHRREVGDTILDHCFTGWSGEATIGRGNATHEVAIDADPACAFLTVFLPQGKPFMAIEPVTHMTDAFNRAARGEPNTGTRVLAPGQSFSCTMRLSLRLINP